MARSFNGTSDFIVNVNAAFSTNIDFTFACWVFLSNLTQGSRFFAHGNTGTGADQALAFNIESAGKFTASVDGIATSAVANANAVVNTWYHVALVHVAATNVTTLFINGVAQTTTATAASSVSGANAVTIGVTSTETSRFLAGNMADAAIWSLALTANELLGLANGARPYQIRPANLLRWWPLDGIQSPEPDLSGGAFNGTLTWTALVFGPPFMPFTPRWPQFPPPPVAPVAVTMLSAPLVFM